MILLGLIFIVVVALAVVAAARPWARDAVHICTAEKPMPSADTGNARWYHPDTEKTESETARRCRHCGRTIEQSA